MISRIETMVLMGKDLPLAAIRSQIASGIDIMVHLGRMRDRSRRVIGIYEVQGIRKGEVRLAPLYEFKEEAGSGTRVEGRLVKTENELTRVGKLLARFGGLS